MAMSATIAVSASTIKTEQAVTAILTITNTAAYSVVMTSVQPFVRLTGSLAPNYNSGVAVGKVDMGPNRNLVVPADSGTLVITFPLRFHGPSTASNSNVYDDSGSNTYDVGALCTSDDNSVFSPTATTITVNYAVNF